MVDERESINPSDSDNEDHQVKSHRILLTPTYTRILERNWIQPDHEGRHGIIARLPNGSYISKPPSADPNLQEIVRDLGISVACTLSSETAHLVLQRLSPFQRSVWNAPQRTEYLVFDNISSIIASRIDISIPSACFCREEKYMLVWCDDLKHLYQHVATVESGLVDLIQKTASFETTEIPARPQSIGISSLPRLALSPLHESNVREALSLETLSSPLYNDLETFPARKATPLTHQVNVALAIVLVIGAQAACITEVFTVSNPLKLALEIRKDGNFKRLGLLVLVPIFAAFSLFFMLTISGSLFQIFGPLPPRASLNYSGIAPNIRKADSIQLPHITIQMPVYKESLSLVIIPTVKNLLTAVKQYEEQGGSASIYVNDDGMQYLDTQFAEARRSFYAINNIGWCARPGHSMTYIRRGKFKKASNMNNALDLSLLVEEEFGKLLGETSPDVPRTRYKPSSVEEQRLYRQAMTTVLERDKQGNWADGNIHVGEIILLVDSDTRVPEDCLLYGAIDMHQNPKIAIIQNSSGVLQTTESAMENYLAYFTRIIYTAVEWTVASGDNAPFVGHNAFLRWRAFDAAKWKDENNKRNWWSDAHVSEDFDLSLRLQVQGYLVCFATYHGSGFKEGVSLTVYDEINRWKKYMYGCNEIIFHPLRYWIFRGPVTVLFRYFLMSSFRLTSKLSILAYMCNYYAIAAAFPLTIINYFLLGWLQNVDKFYISSWRVFIGILVVFNGFAPLGMSMAKHRLGKTSFLASMFEAIKWTPISALYFMGISYHLCKTVLCHALEFHIEWLTTMKEPEGKRRIGLNRIIWDFKDLYFILLGLSGTMIYFGMYAPLSWRITNIEAVSPLVLQIGCHFLLPISSFIL